MESGFFRACKLDDNKSWECMIAWNADSMIMDESPRGHIDLDYMKFIINISYDMIKNYNRRFMQNKITWKTSIQFTRIFFPN